MLHAAAMLIGIFGLWLAATQRWTSPQDYAVAGVVALACVIAAARFGGITRNAFARAPQFLTLILLRAKTVLLGALATMRAAIAADVTLKPALVRVKTRPSSTFAKAALADMISAAPGAVVVDSDAESLLVHVMDEDAIDAEDLGRLEARVLAAFDGKRA